jgi:hypothetical protein
MKPRPDKIDRSAKPSLPHHDFQFDGRTLTWKDPQGVSHDVSYADLAVSIRRKYDVNGRNFIGSTIFPPEGECVVFADAMGQAEDGVENAVFERVEYLGLLFSFNTPSGKHQIKFFHDGNGQVVF